MGTDDSMVTKVVVFGTGQIAEVADYYLGEDPAVDIVAFTVDAAFRDRDVFLDRPVVDFESLEALYPPQEALLFVPISYKEMNTHRESHYLAARERGYRFYTYVSPHARLHKKVEIGENCFVMEDNVIQTGCRIGNNCILWSGNHIGHHTTVEDHCFIASHVVISGSVTVGRNSFLGVNATVRDNIRLGEYSLIGAGALILAPTKPHSAHVGQKATVLPKSSERVKI